MKSQKLVRDWVSSKNKASLSATQRIEVKAKYKLAGSTLKGLAFEYSVSVSTISNCVNNKYR